jgi:hypothetical protein
VVAAGFSAKPLDPGLRRGDVISACRFFERHSGPAIDDAWMLDLKLRRGDII